MARLPQLLYRALPVKICLRMSKNEGRILGYDALKALAAFLVVLYHVGMVDFGYREGIYYIPTITQLMWLFCACPICPKCPIVQSSLPRIARKRDFKSFGLNGISISHFKAPLSAFLGLGV